GSRLHILLSRYVPCALCRHARTRILPRHRLCVKSHKHKLTLTSYTPIPSNSLPIRGVLGSSQTLMLHSSATPTVSERSTHNLKSSNEFSRSRGAMMSPGRAITPITTSHIDPSSKVSRWGNCHCVAADKDKINAGNAANVS